MKQQVWDIYDNGSFVQRVHYMGYVGKVVTKYSKDDKNSNVKVISNEIDC